MKTRNFTYRLRPGSRYAGGDNDAQFIIKLAAALTVYVVLSMLYAGYVIEHTAVYSR